MIGLRSARSRQPDFASLHLFTLAIGGGPDAARVARDAVAERLAEMFDDDGIDALRLVVSELATNCVQHAGADADTPIDITAHLSTDGTVRIDVSTPAPPFAHPHSTACPAPSERQGRGLHLVDVLSLRWGIEPLAANRVWFELATVG